MDRIVVVGASGMLGSALVQELARRGVAHTAPARAELDLDGGLSASVLAVLRPSAVLNAAAYTDVARAELASEARRVWRLNRDAPGELARACRELGVPFVHVSTDYVFDGTKRAPYREDDPVSPLQVYGKSKLDGERAALDGYDGTLVARTSTLYGPGRTARAHFVDAVLEQARRVARLEVVRPPVSCPTFSIDLARGILGLLDAGARGVVNVTNDGGASRLDLAREAVRVAGLAGGCAVVERDVVPGPPARPAYSVLDGTRFAELTGARMRPWREALADYLARPAG